MKARRGVAAIVAALAVGASLPTPILATDAESVTVMVPFRFVAGDMSFASGEYVFTVGDPDRRDVVAMEDGDGRDVELPASLFPSSKPRREGSGVVFHRYGEQYILAEVYVSHERGRYQLDRGAIESELRRAGQQPEEVNVPAEP